MNTMLLNPYRVVGPRPRATAGTARMAALAVLGVAVVGGCSAEPADPAAEPAPTTRPTMPVPTPTPGPTPAPAAATAVPPATPSGVPVAGTPRPPQLTKPGADHTVVRGETLSGLAARFDVPGGWPALFRSNADVLWDPDLIIVGQQLDIDGRP